LIAAIRPRLLIVFPETAALVPCGCTVPVAGIGTAPPSGFDLKAAAADVSPASMASRGGPKDLAVIISSGGSTGVPKRSWRTFEAYARMVTVASPPDRRQLVNGPLAYPSQIVVDMTLLAAAPSYSRTATTRQEPRLPSSTSGSPICSWSSRSYST